MNSISVRKRPMPSAPGGECRSNFVGRGNFAAISNRTPSRVKPGRIREAIHAHAASFQSPLLHRIITTSRFGQFGDQQPEFAVQYRFFTMQLRGGSFQNAGHRRNAKLTGKNRGVRGIFTSVNARPFRWLRSIPSKRLGVRLSAKTIESPSNRITSGSTAGPQICLANCRQTSCTSIARSWTRHCPLPLAWP